MTSTLALLLPCALLLAACGDATAAAPPPAQEAADPARGAELYRRNCQACHGERGMGDGPLAVHLLPRPRNFVSARYRITSTLQRKPTDEDLLATLRRGFPGTAMPSFGHLPEADLRALVARLKSFAETPIEAGVDPERPDRTGPIPVPPEPPDTPEGRARGFALYTESCAACHGPTGRGDGAQEQRDELEMPTWPRNFAAGEWKGGSDGASIYRRVVAGMAGSPMPAASFSGDDAWHVVHWVRAQADLDADGRNEQRRRTIRAARAAGGVPLDGADPAWAGAEETWIALAPLWMRRTPRVQGLRASALHDGKVLGIRLRWEDATDDSSTFGQREFRDAVAVQLSSLADPPFFGMGEAGGTVCIWMWKADRQADAAGRNDLESRFPHAGADGYPAGPAPEEAVVPGLPLARHDPLYLSGRAAGNLVSDLSGKDAAESLVARGPGTVGRCPAGPRVEAAGARAATGWSVVLRRSLDDPDPDGVAFTPGGRASIAFAVWNGSAGDRNGVKSMTIWHDLVLEETGR